MTDVIRDIHLFVSVARIEATLATDGHALQRLPKEIAVIDRAIADLDAAHKQAQDELEAKKAQRRDVERALREHEDHLKKSRGQQPLIKKNDEYTALLKEISNLENAISADEEKLLILMDEIESAEKMTAERSEQLDAERSTRGAEKARLEAEVARLQEEAKRLSDEKPKLLSEISPPLCKKYEKLAAHRDVAVTRVEDEHCGSCRQQLPPQLAVEVRKNDQFITCPACGRILVDYAD